MAVERQWYDSSPFWLVVQRERPKDWTALARVCSSVEEELDSTGGGILISDAIVESCLRRGSKSEEQEQRTAKLLALGFISDKQPGIVMTNWADGSITLGDFSH